MIGSISSNQSRAAANRVAIVAGSAAELKSYIDEALHAIQHQQPLTMGARGGVSYLPHLQRGQTAFIFPGSGNHYVGMGRTLGAHWPGILRAMQRHTDRLRSQMLPHLYDPRRVDWQPGWEAQAYRSLVSDPLHTIFGQVIFGGQMARLLRRFQLRPDAVIGYSLGESAGLFAMGAWPDQGQMLERLASSDLFKHQLAGRCDALRQVWQVPDDQPVQWRVAVVNRPAEQVDAAIAQIPDTRRLIVNTPKECVIGGLAGQVAKVIKQLACEALDLDGVVTVHCDALKPVAQAYKDLHRFPTTPVEGIRFYSCAAGKAYDLTSEAAADSILRQALEGFDFPRTIRQAYADGVRNFLEIGPQSSCTRMIRQILNDQPHLAVAANVRGEDENLTLLKCLGIMASAGAAVDLNPLYGDAPQTFAREPLGSANVIRVPVGGSPMRLPPLPPREAPAPVLPLVSGDLAQPAPPELAASMPEAVSVDEAMSPQMDQLQGMIEELNANVAATAQAHEQYLSLAQDITREFGEAFQMQNQLLEILADFGVAPQPARLEPQRPASGQKVAAQKVAFNREQCLEFAIGSVGKVLGPEFDIIDTYAARVRLPDEPLMLVDRIVLVEGEKCSLKSGRLVTEHDVQPGAWYLDGGRAPVCISVEAGQADLFLSSYLGIDHQVKGTRTYRLLDAKIHFHRGLPQAGETIRYDIHIDKFVKQGATYLFFFRFEGFISAEPLITMTNGCAGFFTEQEVRQSGGIILTDEDRASAAHVQGTPFRPLLTLKNEHYSDLQIDALRSGDAAACFGPDFSGVQLPAPLRLPDGRMRLIQRVIELAPDGGRFGLGMIKAEADIHPNDWFLTCHFVDDQVMPGTLMYECCAHTLRVLLLRLGWVSDRGDVCYEPVTGVPCSLKCRGPVTPQTRHVHYVVEIKEIGYHPEPYVLADAHMYADDHYIVFFKDMSMQMTGVTEEQIKAFWRRRGAQPLPPSAAPAPDVSIPSPQKPLFTREHILAFAIGNPSEAFGAPYRVFDSERLIARLPGPPYCFMDRVTAIEPAPWVLQADGWVEAQYDVPADDWYFAADRSGSMPFCVLLEIALQPCGWLAAYAGSALKSSKDLKFRNLGGKAVIHRNLPPQRQTLTMRTRITKVAEAADMIIEHFDFQVLAADQMIYDGDTNFGFFTPQALAQQVGLRQAVYQPNASELAQIAAAAAAPFFRRGAAGTGRRQARVKFSRPAVCGCRPRRCA